MRFVFALVLLALGVHGAVAQTRVEMERCRAIADATARLACYDAIQLSPSSALSKYEVLDLSELKSFALSYRGDLVEVSGWVTPGAELMEIGADAADKNTIPIDDDLLSRRDRQSFVEACGKGCEATVQGRVRPVNFTTGIVADTIFVN